MKTKQGMTESPKRGAWYASHHRCEHGMLGNVCAVRECEHYDGLTMKTCQNKYMSDGYRGRGLKEREKLVRRGLVALALLACACSAPDGVPAPECGIPDAQFDYAAMQATCDAQCVRCGWGQNAKLASTVVTSAGPVVAMSTPLCRVNVNLCWWALFHEIGHAVLGHTSSSLANEDAADAFAVEHASKDQTSEAICWFSLQSDEFDGAHRQSQDRANFIRGLRQ